MIIRGRSATISSVQVGLDPRRGVAPQFARLRLSPELSGGTADCSPFANCVRVVVMAWSASDVQIVFDVLGTDDPIVTALITTTAGLPRVMATVQRIGRRYAFEGLTFTRRTSPRGVLASPGCFGR